jgi:hypothetical protein
MPGVLFWFLLPLHVIVKLVSIAWCALHGQGRVILRAKNDALLGLPKMSRKRQQIQKSRTTSIDEIWQQLDMLMITRKKRINKQI